MDVKEANNQLDEFEIKQLKNNEKLKQLIASTNHSYSEIYFGEEPIRIKKYMPKSVRHKMLKLAKRMEASTVDTIDEIEKELYPIVADMCVDEPFNKVTTWAYLDEETGCIQDIVLKIAEESGKTDKDLKSFRRVE